MQALSQRSWVILLALSGSGFAALGCNKESQPSNELHSKTEHLTVETANFHSGCADHADDSHDGPEERKRAERRVGWKDPHHKKGKVNRVKILGFNDFHGQLSVGRFVGGRPVGGASVLASYLKAASASAEDGALIIHAGDHVGASPPASALLQDEPSISFMNLLANRHCRSARHPSEKCNIVGTLGNHEFDEGKEEMLRLVYGGNHENGPFLESPYRGAKFSYVSSNVVDEKTKKPLLPPYTVLKLGQVRVGIIGAVLKETPTVVTPTGVAGLSFLDEAQSINRYVGLLRRMGVETIGVTIHQGGRQTSFSGPTDGTGDISGPIVDIVGQLDGAVDFVVSGHTHGFTNALVPNRNDMPVLVTQAFSSSTAYAELDLTIDVRSGDVVEKSAQVITTYSDQAPGSSPDTAVLELVKAAEEATAPLVGQVIGQASTSLLRTESTAGESALGNLIADAQRAATGADIAFMNPGGIRADLEAGEVTWGDLFTIQPFGNSLVTMDLSGQQVVDLLNQQWIGQSSQRIMKSSGIVYTWDTSVPVGENRIVSAEIAGQALDLAAVYRVTVNSFMASGGDNFTVLVAGTNRLGGDVDLDALIEYVQSLTQPFSANIEGRISLIE